MSFTVDLARVNAAPPSTRTPYRLSLQTSAGQSPWTATPLIDTDTPFVFAPLTAAAQISTTDWGTWAEVALAWQFVVDDAGVAGSSIRTRPLRGA